MAMSDSRSEESEVKSIALRWIPPQVDLAHLQRNGKLLLDDQITRIKSRLQNKPSGRYSKNYPPLKDLKLPFSIIKENDRYYAIYYGEKWDKEIGKGGYGKVKCLQNLDTGDWIKAEKAYKKSENSIADRTAKILHHIRRSPSTTPLVEQTAKANASKFRYIVMDNYRGLDLGALIENKSEISRHLSSQDWFDIVIKALEAVKNFHSFRLIHRDIKPSNLIYSYLNRSVQLADFDFVTTAARQDEQHEHVGTLAYMAPEISDEETRRYDEKTEVFALGVTIAEILGITVVDAQFRLGLTAFVDHPLIKEYLFKMTDDDPVKRPTIDDAIQFFKNVRQQLTPNKKKIGIIDFDEFKGKTKQEQKAFMSAVRNMDQVILIDKAGTQESEYWPIAKALEIQGIQVNPSIYIYSDKQKLLSRLPNKIEGNQPGVICSYFYLSMNRNADYGNSTIKPIDVNVDYTDDQYKSQIAVKIDVLKMVPVNLQNPLIKVSEYIAGLIPAAPPGFKDNIKNYIAYMLTHINSEFINSPHYLTAMVIYLNRYLLSKSIILDEKNVFDIMLGSFVFSVQKHSPCPPHETDAIAMAMNRDKNTLHNLMVAFPDHVDYIIGNHNFFLPDQAIQDNANYQQFISDEYRPRAKSFHQALVSVIKNPHRGLFRWPLFSTPNTSLETAKIPIWSQLAVLIDENVQSRERFELDKFESLVELAMIVNINTTNTLREDKAEFDLGAIYNKVATQLYAFNPASFKRVLSHVSEQFPKLDKNVLINNIKTPAGVKLSVANIFDATSSADRPEAKARL